MKPESPFHVAFKNKLRLAGMMILLMSAFTTIAGGGWTQEKGYGFNSLSFTFISAHRYFSQSGQDIFLARNVTDITLNHYLEYGITDRFTFISNLPFKYIATGKTVFGNHQSSTILADGNLLGTSNNQFGMRINLLKKNFILSVQALISLPTIMQDDSRGLITGYDAFIVAPEIQIAKSFKKFYFSSGFGVSLKTNQFSDDINAALEIGTTIKKKFFFAGELVFRKSLFNKKRDDMNFAQTALYVNDQEYFSPLIKAGYFFDEKWSAYFTLGLAFSGNYVAHFPGLSFSVLRKFQIRKKESES